MRVFLTTATAILLTASLDIAPAQSGDAEDSACEIIKTYVLMGAADQPDKRAMIEKLIPACNKSPVRCADTVKWAGLAQQKLDALTCQ